MKISEAKKLTFEEFSELERKCHGFNSEKYINSQIRKPGETFLSFLNKGSKKIMDNPMIKGKLL